MFNKVNRIFIGKDVDRTVAIADGASITTVQSNIAEGEVVLLDQDFNVVAAAATWPTTSTIYVAEGSSEIFNTYNPDGSALTGRRLLLSSPIEGKGVRIYNGKSYAAKAEHTATIPAITDTIVAGTEYVLRIVYKDINEDRGQFTDTYRYTAKSGDTSVDIFDGLRLRLIKDNGRFAIKRRGASRVTANAAGQTSLVLTAKPIPQCTSSVNDIDEFSMVNFEVRLNYVDSDYYWTEVGLTSDVTYTSFDRGVGTWETVRDVEKHAQSYEGVTNRVWFPIVKPEMRTVKGAAYDLVVIEHDKLHRTPDNQYDKTTTLSTQLALETQTNGTNAGGQSLDVVTRLNSWMASVPGQFDNITL